ncbi:MAG: DNA translocase FtsK, partial [Erysipelotrichaceae bacterium]|nr:DNA translocase FtsK [Erysipelotrichaceae bacterium]
TTVMNANSVNADSMDSLYDEVVEFVRMQQKASTSLLQRRFGIGYNRAARLIDTLEDRGIIGPVNGAKPREVYLKPDEESEDLS